MLRCWTGRSPKDSVGFSERATAAAALRHVGIVPLNDRGRVDGKLFAVREYVAGGTLAERAPTLAQVSDKLNVISAVGRALEHAHHHGVVHGALHPRNVLVTDTSQARLVDFLLLGSSSGDFVAPEARRGVSDEYVDQYSLGRLLGWLLGPSVSEHPTLEEAIGRATSADRRHRFVHLEDLLQIVEAPLEQEADGSIDVEVDERIIRVTVTERWSRESLRACVEQIEAALAGPGPWAVAYVLRTYRGYHESGVVSMISELHRRRQGRLQRVAFLATDPQARGLGIILGNSVDNLPWKAFNSPEQMQAWLEEAS